MRMAADIERFAILDFEVSSLSGKSWPIEVGVSWLNKGEVRTWSSLIRPAVGWNLSDWSAQSAVVYDIALEDIQDAPSAFEVAEGLIANLAERECPIFCVTAIWSMLPERSKDDDHI
ncbi:hypothetical protein SAMN04488512_1611, partial [Sulfitobacter litoralis]